MTVSGNIAGLKKGKLFLQHIKDSALVTIDSLELRGDGNFLFSHEIQSPELFYLYLKKADNNDINDRITFFGEKGETTINTSWNTFDAKAKISGSKSQEKFQECSQMLSNFNTKGLELGQALANPEIQNDSTALDSLQQLIAHNIMARYRYVLNFALTNNDSYVAPYIALNEAGEANPKYLDSIVNVLAPEVSNSKYGKALKRHLSSSKQ